MKDLAHKLLILLTLAIGLPATARAQTTAAEPTPTSPRVDAEFAAGGAWFLDESAIDHSLAGGAVQLWLTPQLAVGPEYTYWVGPDDDRDQTLSGNVTYAFRRYGIAPFVVAGAGLLQHSDRFGLDTYSSTEGMFTLGGGVRIPLKAGWYVAPGARIGWSRTPGFTSPSADGSKALGSRLWALGLPTEPEDLGVVEPRELRTYRTEN